LRWRGGFNEYVKLLAKYRSTFRMICRSSVLLASIPPPPGPARLFHRLHQQIPRARRRINGAARPKSSLQIHQSWPVFNHRHTRRLVLHVPRPLYHRFQTSHGGQAMCRSRSDNNGRPPLSLERVLVGNSLATSPLPMGTGAKALLRGRPSPFPVSVPSRFAQSGRARNRQVQGRTRNTIFPKP